MQAAALPWGCSHAEPWGTILPEAFTGLCPVQDNVLHPLPASRLHPQNLSKPWLCMHEPQQHILPASPPSTLGAAPIFPAPARAPQPHKFPAGCFEVSGRASCFCLWRGLSPRCLLPVSRRAAPLPGPGGLPAGLIRMMDGEGAGSTAARPLPGSPNRPSFPRGMRVRGMRSCPKDGVGASGFLAPKAGFGAARTPALGGMMSPCPAPSPLG